MVSNPKCTAILFEHVNIDCDIHAQRARGTEGDQLSTKSSKAEALWWAQAVVYQVYPRSFKDSTGSGLGDLAGVAEKIGYLKELGVDALWLSPFYPSELADGGYDVADYRNVDPRLGTMDDFDHLVSVAHAAGIKVLVDIVPNHTSRLHPWFKEALASKPGSAARARYIFRDGRGPNGDEPPTNWTSHFGGPAWTRVDDGQWYLHLFTWQQPDLNWDNPEVRQDFLTTLRFWSDHGADGFRVDVAHGLAKDLDRDDLNSFSAQEIDLPADGSNPLYDRNEVHQIYREWRQVLNEYDPPRFAVAEAWVNPQRQYLYASTKELGQVFNFEFAKSPWAYHPMHTAIDEGLASARRAHSTSTWVLSNHDVVRVATRYGLPQVEGPRYHQFATDWVTRDGQSYSENRELGLKRARAALLVEMALPGSAYVYQGEELGLPEVATIEWDRLEDPTAFHTDRSATTKGRDGCRVPLPWVADDVQGTATTQLDEFVTRGSFGFSPATNAEGEPSQPAHLPQPAWFANFAVDREEADPNSTLSFYRRALALRRKLRREVDSLDNMDDFEWLPQDAASGKPDGAQGYEGGVLAYRRANGWTCVANFGSEPAQLPEGKVLLTSSELDENGRLQQDTAAWLLA